MKTVMKPIDITPLVCEKTAVFPGDVPFSRKVSLDFSQGHQLTLSSITTTVHMGAHTDAPNHYAKDGVGMDQCSLTPYLGPCQVIEVHIARAQKITSKDFNLDTIEHPRVLFKTSSYPNPNQWNEDFNCLCPKLIDELSEKGVTLVGIDTPSIDPWDSKELHSHKVIAKNKMSILEGVVLDEVSPGNYILIALPLKIKDADASPVRAILLNEERIK